MDIEYTILDENGLDMIEGLWGKLRDHHALKSVQFSGSIKRKTFPERKKELLKKVETGKLRIIVADDAIARKTVGYCVASITEDGHGEIDSIYIEDDYRHRELGNSLMQSAVAWLDSFSPSRVTLQVIVGNEEVFPFYRRYGFEPRSIIMERVNQADSCRQ